MKRKILITLASSALLLATLTLLVPKQGNKLITSNPKKDSSIETLANLDEINPVSKSPLIVSTFDWAFDVSDKSVLYNETDLLVKGKFIKSNEVVMPFEPNVLYTKYTFKIDLAYKGEAQKNQQIDVLISGGEIKVKDYIKLLEKNAPQYLNFKNGGSYYDKDKNETIYQNYGTNPVINNGQDVLLYLNHIDTDNLYTLTALHHGYKEITNGIVKSITDDGTPDFNINEIDK